MYTSLQPPRLLFLIDTSAGCGEEILWLQEKQALWLIGNICINMQYLLFVTVDFTSL